MNYPKEGHKCPKCKKPVYEHIHQDGARFHVISWHGNVDYKGEVDSHSICNIQNCQINHEDKCGYFCFFKPKCTCATMTKYIGQESLKSPKCFVDECFSKKKLKA